MLLDDVLSELDPRRQEYVLNRIAGRTGVHHLLRGNERLERGTACPARVIPYAGIGRSAVMGFLHIGQNVMVNDRRHHRHIRPGHYATSPPRPGEFLDQAEKDERGACRCATTCPSRFWCATSPYHRQIVYISQLTYPDAWLKRAQSRVSTEIPVKLSTGDRQDTGFLGTRQATFQGIRRKMTQ